MVPRPPFICWLDGDAETERLARCFAAHLDAGDTILLRGSIGAGKTHFCRALIRTRLGRQEDVPSPTFTLIQTYDDKVPIWHADLYRLTHPDEAHELGLEEAFTDAICLVEWPDRLGVAIPTDAITVTLRQKDEGREAEINFSGRPSLAQEIHLAFPKAARQAARRELLVTSGWHLARATPLAGDASARRYERLELEEATRILMDAPPGLGDDVSDFARIDRHLVEIGLAAPRIYAENLDQGFLLTEDFGDAVFARLMEKDPQQELALYVAAVDVLHHLQSVPPSIGLADLSAADWASAATMAIDWYCLAITGVKQDALEFTEALHNALLTHADGPRVMILRDYHAENLMWLPDRPGLQRVGLLDFQLAQLGQPGYDLVSLLQDARREVDPSVEQQMIRYFQSLTGGSVEAFLPSYATLGAQRALRILGIFARLCLVSGKMGYVQMIPRVWSHLQRNLARPELHNLKKICDALLPEPTPENLKKIEAQCGNFR